MAGAELPSRAIREQIASAINLIVHQMRLRDGTRRIVNITEVLDFDGERVEVQDIFVFRQTGVDEDGRVLGYLTPDRGTPRCLEHLPPPARPRPIHVHPAPPGGGRRHCMIALASAGRPPQRRRLQPRRPCCWR